MIKRVFVSGLLICCVLGLPVKAKADCQSRFGALTFGLKTTLATVTLAALLVKIGMQGVENRELRGKIEQLERNVAVAENSPNLDAKIRSWAKGFAALRSSEQEAYLTRTHAIARGSLNSRNLLASLRPLVEQLSTEQQVDKWLQWMAAENDRDYRGAYAEVLATLMTKTEKSGQYARKVVSRLISLIGQEGGSDRLRELRLFLSYEELRSEIDLSPEEVAIVAAQHPIAMQKAATTGEYGFGAVTALALLNNPLAAKAGSDIISAEIPNLKDPRQTAELAGALDSLLSNKFYRPTADHFKFVMDRTRDRESSNGAFALESMLSRHEVDEEMMRQAVQPADFSNLFMQTIFRIQRMESKPAEIDNHLRFLTVLASTRSPSEKMTSQQLEEFARVLSPGQNGVFIGDESVRQSAKTLLAEEWVKAFEQNHWQMDVRRSIKPMLDSRAFDLLDANQRKRIAAVADANPSSIYPLVNWRSGAEDLGPSSSQALARLQGDVAKALIAGLSQSLDADPLASRSPKNKDRLNGLAALLNYNPKAEWKAAAQEVFGKFPSEIRNSGDYSQIRETFGNQPNAGR